MEVGRQVDEAHPARPSLLLNGGATAAKSVVEPLCEGPPEESKKLRRRMVLCWLIAGARI